MLTILAPFSDRIKGWYRRLPSKFSLRSLFVLITALAIFLLIRAINTLKKPAAAAPPALTQSEIYLKEIRDALVNK